jgi:hypothetical protein
MLHLTPIINSRVELHYHRLALDALQEVRGGPALPPFCHAYRFLFYELLKQSHKKGPCRLARTQ